MKNTLKRTAMLLIIAGMLQGCAGWLIGQATDVAVETAKIPFKIGGAALDVVTPDNVKGPLKFGASAALSQIKP